MTDVSRLDPFVPTSELYLAILFHNTVFVFFSLKVEKKPVANVYGLPELAAGYLRERPPSPLPTSRRS